MAKQYYVEPGPQAHDDDIQKDRWGGKAERRGRRLRCVYYGGGEEGFDFNLVVESTDGSPLEGPVVFHLHDTYGKWMDKEVKRVWREAYAVLTDDSYDAYETFTAAAEVKDRNGEWLGLELDLENVRAIPGAYKPRPIMIQTRGAEVSCARVRRGDGGKGELKLQSNGKGTATTGDAVKLQAMLSKHAMFTEPVKWRRRWEEAEEGWVCRVGLGNSALGTGVLVGPDLVLTNWHVIEGVADEADSGLAFEFDYKYGEGSSPPKAFVRYAASKDWLVAHSPYAESEKAGGKSKADPTPSELDFALVRLAPPDQPDRPRGHASVDMRPQLKEGLPLMIMQHPKKAPLSLAIDTNAIIGFNDPKTRVRYATSTEDGSSGSPCFDLDWNLVALHHAGAPDWENQAGYNQGIPINLLRDHVKAARKAP